MTSLTLSIANSSKKPPMLNPRCSTIKWKEITIDTSQNTPLELLMIVLDKKHMLPIRVPLKLPKLSLRQLILLD
jgi:hypothetical protein